jgi:hypothetical protein
MVKSPTIKLVLFKDKVFYLKKHVFGLSYVVCNGAGRTAKASGENHPQILFYATRLASKYDETVHFAVLEHHSTLCCVMRRKHKRWMALVVMWSH